MTTLTPRLVTLALALTLSACANAPSQPAPATAATVATPPSTAARDCSSDYMAPGGTLHATAWMQRSAEYRALTATTYRQAVPALARLLAVPAASADLKHASPDASLPPAVIMDLDETVLDNSAAQARWLAAGLCAGDFEPHWDQWVAEASAAAVPGAIGYIRSARMMRDPAGRPVRVIFVTNRECRAPAGSADPCPQKQQTLDNLRKLGLDSPTLAEDTLLKGERPGWGSEKQSRRDVIARDYRIVQLVGDDFGDFLEGARSISVEEREAARCRHADLWGERWVLLPNPVYGSWQVRLVHSGQPPLQPDRPAISFECPQP